MWTADDDLLIKLGRAGLLTGKGVDGLPTGTWPVPKNVRLKGSELHWTKKDADLPAAAEPNLIEDFWELDDKTTVLDFARRYGPLNLCRHRLPWTHNPSRPEAYPWAPPTTLEAQLFSGCWPEKTERVADWLCIVRSARAVRNITAYLLEGELGRAEDWSEAFLDHEKWPDPVSLAGMSSQMERHLLAQALNEWINMAPPRLWVGWYLESEAPEASFTCPGLIGALTMQLVAAVVGPDGLAVCANCHRPYRPVNRRPKEGSNHFCPACRDTGRWKLSKRKTRSTSRGGQQR
jgi:hypothetical protein